MTVENKQKVIYWGISCISFAILTMAFNFNFFLLTATFFSFIKLMLKLVPYNVVEILGNATFSVIFICIWTAVSVIYLFSSLNFHNFLISILFSIIAVLSFVAESASRSFDKTAKEKENHFSETQQSTKPLDESQKNYVLFDDVEGNNIIKYEYEDKMFLLENVINTLSGHGGEDLTFSPEPENEYDNKAVAIFLDEAKVGYVYKGKIQDMLNDWIKRNDFFRGYINKINKPENFVTYKIAFYKNKDTFEHKTFSLVKTGKKINEDLKRSDNLELMSEGDAVSVDYDSYDDCFVVYNEDYEEIGELPSSAENFIGEDAKCIGIIESMDYDDNGKPKAKVTIYLLDKAEEISFVADHMSNPDNTDLSDGYVVIDIETTGFSPNKDAIIELAAIKVNNGIVCDKFSSLVNPEREITDLIQNLTGISNEMVSAAPKLQEVLPEYLDFIGNNTIVGHNVRFDINFLQNNTYNAPATSFSNGFVDTLKLSRKYLPQLPNYKLSTVLEHFSIKNETAHRALSDCYATKELFDKLNMFENGILETPIDLKPLEKKNDYHYTLLDVENIDTSNPVYGKYFVFTGSLDHMEREDAKQCVLNLGGLVRSTVSKKTNFLVLGDNSHDIRVKDGISTKQKKAQDLKLNGNDIEIISEDVFYDMLADGGINIYE